MNDLKNNFSSIVNKSILITGGTGSFGHKFVDYALKNLSPKKLVVFLVETNSNNLRCLENIQKKIFLVFVTS